MVDFYKQNNGTYYTTDNKRVLNLAELQSLAKAGGKEIAPPSPVSPVTNVGSGTSTGVAGAMLPQPPIVGANPGVDQANIFNTMMMSSLKAAQGVNTDDLLKKKRDLERSYLNQAQTLTPENLRTLSPDQQNQMRNSNLQALKVPIDENAYQLQKAETAIKNFQDTFWNMKKLGDEFTEKMAPPLSVIESAKHIIEADPSKLQTILSQFNDKGKQAIIGSLDFNKLTPVEEWDIVSVDDGFGGKTSMRYNKKTNELKPIGSSGGYSEQQAPDNLSSILPTDGTVGGQCGDYLHDTMRNTPIFGDTWQSKQSAMNTSPLEFSKAPQVGDIVAFKEKLPTGHVAAVIAVNGNKITLSESNYGLKEKVTNTRIVDANDPRIIGAYRGASFKGAETSAPVNANEAAITKALNDPNYYKGLTQAQQSVVDRYAAANGSNRKLISDEDLHAYGTIYASDGVIPTGLPTGSFSQITEYAKKLPKYDGQLIDLTTGVTPAKEKLARLGNANTNDGLAASYEFLKNIKELKERYDAVLATGIIPGLWSKVFPTDDQQNLDDLRNQLVDLLARARTGAVINASEQKLYESMLPSNFSTPAGLGKSGDLQIDNLMKIFSNKIDTVTSLYGVDIIGRPSMVNVNGKQVPATRSYQDGQWGWETENN